MVRIESAHDTSWGVGPFRVSVIGVLIPAPPAGPNPPAKDRAVQEYFRLKRYGFYPWNDRRMAGRFSPAHDQIEGSTQQVKLDHRCAAHVADGLEYTAVGFYAVRGASKVVKRARWIRMGPAALVIHSWKPSA